MTHGELMDHRSLQLVVLPTRDADEVLPLYVEGPAQPERVLDRRRYRVPARRRTSFASYFNAFPAAWWQRWTGITDIELHVAVSSAATVRVFRSAPDGISSPVATVELDATGEARIPLTLKGFDEGGWLWFELGAGEHDAVLESASWTLPDPPGRVRVSTASVGITTFDRVDWCVALLDQIAADAGLRAHLDRVYVVDQGTQRLAEAPTFDDVAGRLGETLRVVEQPNLGGSGGFARSQLEFLDDARSDFLVLLDDDIVLEPESVRRAIVFAGLCEQPVIVGGQMLSRYEPTRLHALGEVIDSRRFWWGPRDARERAHDLAEQNLRQTPWMHEHHEVDYNGWWLSLIPRTVLADVGLALPLFLKWDDAEFGLRAKKTGHPTVALPGVGVWHVAWTDKDDVIDWQAYFHERNRVIAALLHSPRARGGALIKELFLHHVKHLAAMRYSTAALRQRALTDVLRGPDELHRRLPDKLAEVREWQARYRDGRVVAAGELPEISHVPRDSAGEGRSMRSVAVRGVLRQLRRTPDSAKRRPQVRLRNDEAHWSRLVAYDSAVVETADGSGGFWHQRDRALFVRMVCDSAVLHARLYREWPRLAARYRAASTQLSSPRQWRQTFDQVRRAHEPG